MAGAELFTFETWPRTLIRVSLQASNLSPEQQLLGRKTAHALRFALEAQSPHALELAQRLHRALRGAVASPSQAELTLGPFSDGLAERLTQAFESGRLVVQLVPPDVPRAVREASTERPLPPRAPERSSDTFFELRLVDETGQGIPGIAVEFLFDGEVRDVTSNAAGVALLDGVQAPSVTASATDVLALDAVLDSRWDKPRVAAARKEGNSSKLVFEGQALDSLSIKPATPNTVVFMPPLGIIALELWDKAGRIRHANLPYRVSGPAAFSGVTDERGQLRHEGVFPGDYLLELSLDVSRNGRVSKLQLTSPLVVLGGNAPVQVRRLGASPRTVLVRLHGPMFERNKSFLLPGAIPRFSELSDLYQNQAPSELLIVGHADTTSDRAINDPLSLERADNVLAFLKDDVDPWLAMYESGVPAARRWSGHEDTLMLATLLDGADAPPADPLRSFQRSRGLAVDGAAGPKTRAQLIREYMQRDGARLEPERLAMGTTTHGCGENFPLDASGRELDSTPADGTDDPGDRRVELFFFDKDLGIVPPPPGKNSEAGSPEYPAWRKTVQETVEIAADPTSPADCDLDLALELSNGAALASRPCSVTVNGKVRALATDGNGRLFLDALPPDDYLLEVEGIRWFVTAVKRGQGSRRLRLPSSPARVGG